tara:strand:+ start:496 stop:1641 length:1146 start_codon:yes stop_codon:yes gene_type:complete
MKKKKIAIICNTDGALFNFRKPLIQSHSSEGWEVHTLSNNYDNYFKELKELKCSPHLLKFNQKNSFLENLSVIKSAISIIKKIKPDIIHIYTLQPIILLSIPLKLIGCNKVFSTVTGMGRNFGIYDTPLTRKQKLILFALKLSFMANRKVHVQNNFDKEFFLNHNVIPSKKLTKVNGSGMDIMNRNKDLSSMKENSELAKKLNLNSNKRIILFPARGMSEKGLFHFAESARIVSEITSDFQFVHVGGYPDFMSKTDYEDFAKNHNYVALGYIKNIASLFLLSDVIILPSLYREGTPKSLLEAIYFNKKIITNDVPGCNETVIDGANGWLSKPGSTNDLVSKILKINDLNNDLVKKTNDYLVTKYNINKIYELNKLMYYDKI